jgi:P27 family predicted phage terminase small subunit
MGRRKQDPDLQLKRGAPSRRRKQTEAAAKAKMEAPAGDAVVEAHLDIAGMKPPARLMGAKFKDALEVWRRIAPRLKQTVRASAEFADLLAAYCDCVARYNEACVLLVKDGYTQIVDTVSGGQMVRLNPAERIRERALGEMLQLSQRFGFTPADNYALLIDHRKVIERGAQQGGLPLEGADGSQSQASPVGQMANFDSAPPTGLHS